jgi:hypothetical protein
MTGVVPPVEVMGAEADTDVTVPLPEPLLLKITQSDARK